MQTRVPWTSPYGTVLNFEVHPPRANWNDHPGLYMFCKYQLGSWVPVYVGQAASLKNRLCGHDRWDEAVRLGATTVHAIVVHRQDERDLHERALIQHFNPTLNVQHRLPLKPEGMAGGGIMQLALSSALLRR